jgi:hypothetical protein
VAPGHEPDAEGEAVTIRESLAGFEQREIPINCVPRHAEAESSDIRSGQRRGEYARLKAIEFLAVGYLLEHPCATKGVGSGEILPVSRLPRGGRDNDRSKQKGQHILLLVYFGLSSQGTVGIIARVGAAGYDCTFLRTAPETTIGL